MSKNLTAATANSRRLHPTGFRTMKRLLTLLAGLFLVGLCGTATPVLAGGANTCCIPLIPGLGAMTAVPAPSTNGTAISAVPPGGVGVRIYLGVADSVTFTIASTAPSSAPTITFTISGASSGTGPNWDENLAAGEMIYVTATTGSPKFRWF